MKDQWRLFGAAGIVEDFEHGEGVVAGGDFLDQASGEGGGEPSISTAVPSAVHETPSKRLSAGPAS